MNREKRVEFLIQKLGLHVINLLVKQTDKEVKSFYDYKYPTLKHAPDYVEPKKQEYSPVNYAPVLCDRCGEEPTKTYQCACGENRVIFDADMWLDDIKCYSEYDNYDFVNEKNELFLKKIKDTQ